MKRQAYLFLIFSIALLSCGTDAEATESTDSAETVEGETEANDSIPTDSKQDEAPKTAVVYPDFMSLTFRESNIPEGWNIHSEADGDLNGDGISDKAVIYESDDSLSDTRCEGGYENFIMQRVIVVYYDIGGELSPKVQNNKFIGRVDEGGMLPFLEAQLSIDDNKLSIFYEYTRSSTKYTFELTEEGLVLTRATSGGVSSPGEGTTEFHDYDFVEGFITVETGTIDSDEYESEKVRIENPILKPLSDFGCMGEWKVGEYYYL